MQILNTVLLLVAGLLVAIIALQHFGGALLDAGGSGNVTVHQVPAFGKMAAIGIFAIALFWVVSRGGIGGTALSVIAIGALTFASHRLVEDNMRGTVSDQWALIRTQEARFDIVDGPAPTYSQSVAGISIATADQKLTTARGIWPIAIAIDS